MSRSRASTRSCARPYVPSSSAPALTAPHGGVRHTRQRRRSHARGPDRGDERRSHRRWLGLRRGHGSVIHRPVAWRLGEVAFPFVGPSHPPLDLEQEVEVAAVDHRGEAVTLLAIDQQQLRKPQLPPLWPKYQDPPIASSPPPPRSCVSNPSANEPMPAGSVMSFAESVVSRRLLWPRRARHTSIASSERSRGVVHSPAAASSG